MKNITFILLILVGTFRFLSVYAANVNIPDPNLRDALVELLGKRPHQRITEADMETFKELDLTDKGIRDLTGIEHATRLERLTLTDNLIDDLTPISELISLAYLRINNNVISDLSPLTNLMGLRDIHFPDNIVSDLSPLGGLLKLNTIWFDHNDVSDLSPLLTCVNLGYISSWGNPISDLTPVAKLPKLWFLNISGGSVLEDISPLAEKIGLRELYLRAHNIADWTPLASISTLEKLSLEGSNITDGQLLMGLRLLKWLALANTPLSKDDIWEIQLALPNTKIVKHSSKWNPFKEDVNSDGNVNILDLILIGQNIGKKKSELERADVDGNGIINISDLITVASKMDELDAAAAPSLTVKHQHSLTQATVQQWIRIARAKDDGSAVFQRGIANLQYLSSSLIYPKKIIPTVWGRHKCLADGKEH